MASMYIQAMQLGSAAFSAHSNLTVANIQADMQESARAFSNQMRSISAAQQINAVTQEQVNLGDASKRLAVTLQQSSLRDRGAAEVSAAAAGVTGGSVDQALLGLRRSAVQAQHARKRNLDSGVLASAKQKSNINLARVMGEDISIIQRPSTASAMLGLGASVIDIMDSNNPEGNKSTDPTVDFDWFKPY